MKKLAIIVAALLLITTPALATSVEDLISGLESELATVPDLSGAFGSAGEAQGEVFATGVITGEGTLYDDDGTGNAGADLLLLQQGFSASAVLVADRAGTLYARGAASVLILPQIIPGKTLVVVGDGSTPSAPAETARPTPAPIYNAISLTVGGTTQTLEQSTPVFPAKVRSSLSDCRWRSPPGMCLRRKARPTPLTAILTYLILMKTVPSGTRSPGAAPRASLPI